MTAKPLIAGLPPDLELPDGYIVRFNALDPTNGALITGVVVESVSIFGTNLGVAESATFGPFKLVPGPGA